MSLKDKTNTKWSDGTTTDKSATWKIYSPDLVLYDNDTATIRSNVLRSSASNGSDNIYNNENSYIMSSNFQDSTSFSVNDLKIDVRNVGGDFYPGLMNCDTYVYCSKIYLTYDD